MCDLCAWEEVVEEIQGMLEEEEFEFASDTLEGIKDWIQENEHCTEAQKDAVQNIKESVYDE